VYIQDILDECLVPEPQKLAPWQQHQQIKSPTNDPTSPTSSQGDPNNFKWKSLILLVPLRLGTEKMNLIYGDCLKAMLSLEHCIGIIGGRPKHSLYFVGYQEDKLIHLDPHYCQDMVDVNQEMFSTASFHCRSPRKMKLTKMDPCCCIGFYCATKNDFDRFVSSVQPVSFIRIFDREC
jgi:cysteine protease ATG4